MGLPFDFFYCLLPRQFWTLFFNIICYWESLNPPIFTFFFDDMLLGKLETLPFCFFNNAREPKILWQCTFLFQEGKKTRLFFLFLFWWCIVDWVQSSIFFFFVSFPFDKEKKGGNFQWTPFFALGWYFKRINQNVKKRHQLAPINNKWTL